ncbi:hypothetical protein GCM10011611_07300 [Aliidongia dinghuensis]|uniref:Uncharacterized protein n=1 Tax=Aliidongia dinghuensis TaxID=1867774 RepID=A0A8J2YPV6_9PROT|nr:hypothetical protein [Aliidongia dinghuensis]GGF04437.1 hypothetical protein GCM10011611_07300 [Aliidongia dinghuensis]
MTHLLASGYKAGPAAYHERGFAAACGGEALIVRRDRRPVLPSLIAEGAA